MKSLIFGLVFFSSVTMARTVDFVVNVPFLTPAGEQVYLTGEGAELCDWKVNCLLMKQIDETVWKASVEFTGSVEEIKFKVTRGDWSREEVTSHGNHLPFHSVKLNEHEGPVVVNIAHWKDLRPLQFTGNHRVIKDFYVPQLERSKDVSIWLPPSYKEDENKRYPVIYMHDGQNVFSPYTAVFGNEWSVDEVMEKLIALGKVREAIIVASTSDKFERSLEYHVYKKGRQYARFVVDTLKPYIDKNFRTLPDRKNTFLMGSSFGALISFTILWEHSDVFSKAAGLSFPAHAHNNYIFDFVKNEPIPSQEVYFWMDHGLYGIDSRYAPHGENWVNHLLGLGFPSEQLEFRTFEYANHTELDWAQRVHLPLQYLLN
ncbi:MAG: hypothetical protein EP319_13185 [Deltaproteobacteria bacterium]|nr:MAG: hypothetical protein EP319_13185 [Deltaproteobacteria bacterium]